MTNLLCKCVGIRPLRPGHHLIFILAVKILTIFSDIKQITSQKRDNLKRNLSGNLIIDNIKTITTNTLSIFQGCLMSDSVWVSSVLRYFGVNKRWLLYGGQTAAERSCGHRKESSDESTQVRLGSFAWVTHKIFPKIARAHHIFIILDLSLGHKTKLEKLHW